MKVGEIAFRKTSRDRQIRHSYAHIIDLLLESLFADVRFALRWLRRSPGFALVAVASLAVGIGFNTTLFAVVDALLFKPLPVRDIDRLVDVFTNGSADTATFASSTSSYPDYLDLKSQSEVFEDVCGYTSMFAPLNLADRSRLVLGEAVTGNYFRVLGVGAAIGRTLEPEDDAPSARKVAMVSYRYWTREFGGSPSALGKTITLRGDPFTIVGVAPAGFNGMFSILSPEIWIPVSASLPFEPIGIHDTVPSPGAATRLERRGDRWLWIRGRLKPGLSTAEASANVEVIMSRLVAAYPVTNKNRRMSAKATSDIHFHPAADRTLVPIAVGLMAVVGLVLLIACANVASMLLARASSRQREIGIRLAIGATRRRLVRQLLTESFVMSLIGAAAGVLVALWATRLLQSVPLPLPIPLSFDLRIDIRVLLFTLGATVVAGLLAGLAPALQASSPNVTLGLKGEALMTRSARRRWTPGDALVAAQIAVTAVLLIVAALLVRSVLAAERVDVGIDVQHLAVVSTDPAMAQYTDERTKRFWEEAVARVSAIPGVEAAALATRVPFSINFNRWSIWVPGRHQPGQSDTVEVTAVSPGYFRAIGVRLVDGRFFTDDDRPETPSVAIVNETFARRYWPGLRAVGRTFRSRIADGPEFQIVGVVSDHKVNTIGEPPTPFLHLPRAQRPNSYSAIVARTRGDAAQLVRDINRELLALEPNLVFVENQTMRAEVGTTLFPIRASAWLVGLVGAMAMLLAAIGLYGVIAYSVARQTREIGIRMALGARPSTVLAQVMRHGLLVAAAGLIVGAALATAAARLIAGALYGIGTGDPVSWLSAVVLLLSVSALANFVPASRAARVDPSVALRTE